MTVIPLEIFNSFKLKANEKIYLFDKEIINKVKNTNKFKKNPLNLYLNKINCDNYLIQSKKFLNDIYITKDKFNDLTTNFFSKIISEDKFTEQYLLFYKIILDNYYEKYKYDFSYFVNLIESKFIIDFENKSVLLQDIINKLIIFPQDIEQEEQENYIKTYKINNLKIIYYMIKHKILNPKIKDNIYLILNTVNNYEYLYEFIKLNEDIEFLDIFYKNNFDNLNLRLQTLFKELKIKLTKLTKKSTPIINIKKNTPKISSHVLITNIIEEYLFLDEIEEVGIFIENYILKKNLQIKFVETVINYGKNNNKENEMTKLLDSVKHILKKKPVNTKNL